MNNGVMGGYLVWILNLFRQEKKRPRPIPKWRLVPDQHGTYTLDKWNSRVSMYLCEAVKLEPDQADKIIKNLEGKTLYYREEK